MSPTNPLLVRPILPTLLRLSVPTLIAMMATALVAIAETSYVGLLGTGPLAAMALVFPMVMLQQMMSSGAMGGGISSAIARALGAGDDSESKYLPRPCRHLALTRSRSIPGPQFPFSVAR